MCEESSVNAWALGRTRVCWTYFLSFVTGWVNSARLRGSVDVRLDATDTTGSGAGNSSAGNTGERILGDCRPAVLVRFRMALRL